MIKRKSIFQGAVILTSANIITRVLGFVYRIYMSNTIGAEGMGLYQLIMPLYSLFWSITCSGFTTTISKLTAQENAKKQYGNMGRILKQSLLISCSLAVLISIFCYFGAELISDIMFHDERTVLPLKILAFAIPFMAAGSCIRGYFLGLLQSETPAISQVLEQIIRMVLIYALAGTFIPMGLEYACVAAVIGIVAGEAISFIYVFFSYKRFKSKHNLVSRPSLSSRQVLGIIMAMAVPLTLNRVTGSFLSTVENSLIPQQLQLFGMTRAEAMSAYGRITGMAMPLVFFPSAFLTALSVSLVPAVSEAAALNNYGKIQSVVAKSLLFTSIIGIAAATVFFVLPAELGRIIYNQDISEMLFMLGMMCPFWYMSITFSGILNGLGHQMFIFKNSLMSSVINILFIYFLVPHFGVNAFIFGWFISLAVTLSISIIKIKKEAKIGIPVIKWFIKPGIGALAAGLLSNLLKKYLFTFFSPPFALFGSVCLICLLYLVFILATGCIKTSDISAIFKRIK